MRSNEVARTFVGSVVVYLAMAACGSSSGDGAVSLGDGGGGSITDPVPTASAAPETPPDVAVEVCSSTYDIGGGQKMAYATHAYPGATQKDLARQVVALGTADPPTPRPPSFNAQVAAIWVNDGAVAVACGTDKSRAYISVTFIRTI